MLRRYRFLTYNDIAIIPQGYDPDDYRIDDTFKLPYSKKMRFTYAGTFYRNRTPKYFLRALSEVLKEHPNLKKKIESIFIGTFRKENLAMIESLGLTDVVKVFGYLDHRSTVRYLMTSDVLWLTIGNGKGEDQISTGKLFEYIGSRKPILGLVPDGIAKSTIIESGAGKVLNPDDVAGIKNAILEYYGLWEKKAAFRNSIRVCTGIFDRVRLAGEASRGSWRFNSIIEVHTSK